MQERGLTCVRVRRYTLSPMVYSGQAGAIDRENVGKGQPTKRRTSEHSSRHHLAFCHEQPLGSLGKPIGISGIGKGRHCPSGANPLPLYAWRAPILKEALPPEALPQK